MSRRLTVVRSETADPVDFKRRSASASEQIIVRVSFSAELRMGGTGPGRRYRTEQLNLALIVRLAGEFQGFARDLHTEAIDHVYASMITSNSVWAEVIQEQLADGRALDRRNATPSTLGADFVRFGLELLPALRTRDARNAQRQHHLERLTRHGTQSPTPAQQAFNSSLPRASTSTLPCSNDGVALPTSSPPAWTSLWQSISRRPSTPRYPGSEYQSGDHLGRQLEAQHG
jgi:hypothetical protein